MEKAKSFILTVLVLVSLVQSYMLGYSSPRPEPISTGEYVETEQLSGSQAELKDVVFPDQIILHYGKKTHTVLYPMPFLNHYRNIFDFLRQRTFDGLRKTNVFAANIDWDDIRDNYQGIEVRFQEGIPFNVLQSLMTISKEEASSENELITRIWIYKGTKDDVKAFFISDTNVMVYEAVKADVTVKDLDVRLKLGESLTKYHTVDGDYYLPDEPVPAIQITMPYTLYTADQLKRSLFVDPSQIRSLPDRDGNQIFTDSIRGLQIRTNQRWMIFSDPVTAPVDSKNEIKVNLLSTIQFINQHGGWNSTFLYSNVAPRQVFGPQTIVFRQYLEGYPVVNVKNDNIGYMKVVVQKGIVSNFERSLIIPDPKGTAKQQTVLEGGASLDAKLQQYSKKALVTRVFPGLKPVVKEKTVEYMPKWIAELRDGSLEVIE
ncbi:YycH family regulatory protein [Gorillibacterium sp. sgz5001074]|uniref:YycH family regulatory protein n=1 Tax=Gorillibacterium sp. sgz5001074 TaxID=3446695 RepID=UPI003F6749BF